LVWRSSCSRRWDRILLDKEAERRQHHEVVKVCMCFILGQYADGSVAVASRQAKRTGRWRSLLRHECFCEAGPVPSQSVLKPLLTAQESHELGCLTITARPTPSTLHAFYAFVSAPKLHILPW
jgi:hypothetical protein